MLVNGTKLYYKKGDVTEYAELKKLTSLPDINVRKEKIENTHTYVHKQKLVNLV